jgi:tRNA-dihydrouridine synthase
MIGKLKAKHPNFPIAIISTDSIKNYETSREILEDYGLENVTTWAFAESFVEPIRHSIDNTWFGELPRTYFYNDQNQREAHSGVLTQEQLDRFSKLVLAP